MGHIYRSTDKKLPRELRAQFDAVQGQKLMREFGEADAILKAFDPKGEMIVGGCANKAKPDRWNEIIDPEAWDIKNFLKNPVILREHNRAWVIGKAIECVVKKDGLYYKAQIGDPSICELTAMQIESRSLLAQGYLKTNSVGFVPHVIEYDEDNDVLRYTAVELLEISIVTIPMQQDSLITSVKSWKGKTMEKEVADLKKSVDAQGEVLKSVQETLAKKTADQDAALAKANAEIATLKAATEAQAKELVEVKADRDETEKGAQALLAKLTETGAIKAVEAPAA